MSFHLIARLFGVTAKAINKRMQPKAAQLKGMQPKAEIPGEATNQIVPQPRHVHDPLYKRHDETLRTTRLTNFSFNCVERQSKSRWVMGSYNAAPGQTIVTTRATMPEENDEFSHYISSTLKKNILDRYVEITGNHVVDPRVLSGNPFVRPQEPVDTEIIYPDSAYRRDLELESPVAMAVAVTSDDEFAATIPDTDSNLIFLPDSSTLSGFAKLLARRRRLAHIANIKEQSITADHFAYDAPVQQCVMPWGEVQVVDVLEELQAVPLSPIELPEAAVEVTEQTMTISQSNTGAVAALFEVQRMLKEFDELDYIQYILSAKTDTKILARIAENSCTPAIVLAQLAFHRELSIRCAVAENANTPIEALWFLVQDEDPTVRYALAENCHVPSDVLQFLCTDENAYVSSRAHKTINRTRPNKVIARSFGKSSPVRRAVAS